MMTFATAVMRALNKPETIILAGSAVVLAESPWLVRSQSTVGEVSWMKALIEDLERKQ